MTDPNANLIATCLVGGIVMLTLICVNVWHIAQYRLKKITDGSATRLGIVGWSISVASLIIPYFSPISLIIGAIDMAQNRKIDNSPTKHIADVLILVNSVCSIIYLTAIFYIILVVMNKK